VNLAFGSIGDLPLFLWPRFGGRNCCRRRAALRSAKSNVNAVLHQGSAAYYRTSLAAHGLVALQIAGSLVLLVVTGCSWQSSAMQTMDFGFKPDHVLNLAIDANEIG